MNTKVLFFSFFFPLCIRFQLGNSFVNTKVFFPFCFLFFSFMYSFSTRQFIIEYKNGKKVLFYVFVFNHSENTKMNNKKNTLNIKMHVCTPLNKVF